jgi:uncharacterized iron-regulated protein
MVLVKKRLSLHHPFYGCFPGSGTVLCGLLLLCLTGCAAREAVLADPLESPYRDPLTLQKGEILHLETGRLVTEPELLDYVSHFPVVYVGETHDSVDDHEVQFAILKGLRERFPGNVALGLEMLPREAQSDLDAYLGGEMDPDAFARIWVKHWGHTFGYYREILRFARLHRIPVLALNTDADLKKALRKAPPEQLSPELAGRLPEMDLEDPYHKAMNDGFFKGHPMGPGTAEAFYRIQVLWDETMAETAADYLKSEKGRGKHLLILAGGNHVRYGFGIPRRLFRRTSLPYVIVAPFTVEIPENKKDRFMKVELPVFPLKPADFYWAVGYRDLEDLRMQSGQ